MDTRLTRLGLLGVLILTAVLYAPTRGHGFVYEDLQGWSETPPPVSFPGRGLTAWSQYLTWRAVGLEPAWSHAGNVSVHLLNGVMVYAIAAALVAPLAALLAATVFLVHPLNTAAVASVSGRADLLLTSFVLAAVWLSLGRSGVRTLGLAMALLLAALSKEIGLMGVGLVALTALVWRPDAARTPLVVSGAAVVAGIVLGQAWPSLMGWFEMPARVGGPSLPWGEFLVLQCAALWHLLALTVWPVGFSIDHDALALSAASRVLAVILTISALALIPVLWRARPLVAWGIAWVALCVAPRFVFRTSEFLTEPQSYPAMAGMSLLFGSGLSALWLWSPHRRQERTA